MKNHILLWVCILCLPCFIKAQNNAYDEYLAKINSERDAYVAKRNKEYDAYRARINAEYEDYIRRAWEQYTAITGIPRPKEEPVPPVIYEEDQQDKDQQQDKEIKADTIPQPQPTPRPEPVVPIIQQEEPEPSPQPDATVQAVFYGNEIKVRVPKNAKISIRQLSGDAIAEAWDVLVGGAYDNFWYDLFEQANQYKLCDWAFFELVQSVSEKRYGVSNEAVLLQAATYATAGFATRLAASDTKLYVLLGSQYELYEQPYFKLDGLCFYPLNCDEEKLQICSGAYESEQPFSLNISAEQLFSMQSKCAPRRQSAKGISVAPTINLNTISFYNSYPTGQVGGDCGTRWATYANAPLEECVRQSLYPTLRQAIRGVPEAQAVDKLLNWVQTAFEYEYDDKVWGHDRAFFPSESLHYPYADCEDRAILFSRIVRDLLDLDVLLIYYPGHLATAVNFHQDVKGDYVQLNNKKYIICDPTYIGAPIGITMPDMDNQTAKLIPLKR